MFAKGEISLSTDYILNLVSDVDLINYYFNITSIPCLTHSPLREDNNPSFSIFQGISNKVFFKDFGTNQTGDIFTLLSLYWNCSRADALQKIYLDLILIEDLETEKILPLVILLFVSMVPLHSDRKDRQEAMLLNALRLYKEYCI